MLPSKDHLRAVVVVDTSTRCPGFKMKQYVKQKGQYIADGDNSVWLALRTKGQISVMPAGNFSGQSK